MIASNRHRPWLDILRAIACFGVVVAHTGGLVAKESSESRVNSIKIIFSAGRLGVEVFFFLSGLLLATLYEVGGDVDGAISSTRRYLVRRFSRIWPLWSLFAFVWAIKIVYIENRSLDFAVVGLLLSLSFMLWTSPTHNQDGMPGATSIQQEVALYLVFWTLRRRPISWIITLTIIINVLGVVVSFSALSELGVSSSLRRLSLQTGMNFFVLGMVLARARACVPENTDIKQLAQIFRRTITPIRAALLSIWLGTFLFAPASYGNTIEAVGFLALSVVVTSLISQVPRLSRLFQHIGQRSYFVFFSHFLVLEIFDKYLRLEIDGTLAIMAIPLLAVLNTSICLIVANLSFRYFESPLMRMARKV